MQSLKKYRNKGCIVFFFNMQETAKFVLLNAYYMENCSLGVYYVR